MSPFPQRWIPSPARIAVAIATLATLAIAGCSNNNNSILNPGGGGGGGSTTFDGTISGSGASGSLTLTVSTSNPAPQPGPARARASVTASGTLQPVGGAPVGLAGTYDDASDIITVAGGGWTLAGGLTTFGMEGTFSGPGGVSGVFSVQRRGAGSDTVIVVVGDFTSTTGGPGGVFNFSIRGTTLHGNAFETGASFAVPLDGTYTPGTGVISIVNPSDPTGPPLATGTLLADGSASGNYDDGAGEAGTWAGTKQ